MKYGRIFSFAFFASVSATTAACALCPTFSSFSNGDPADANQVMDNFNYILGCPNFTGSVGIGTASPVATLDVLSTGTAIKATVAEGNYAFLSDNSSSGNKQWGWEVVGNNMAFREAGVADRLTIQAGGNIGIGTTTPAQSLEVNGKIQVDSLASASGTALCINANIIASCSSSRRYKENIRSATFGIKEIRAMRPVTFKWKGRREQDFGLIAEEVAKVNPLFVTYQNGRVEGVKYPQLTAVLIGAVKELQAKNEVQATKLEHLESKFEKLEIIVRRSNQGHGQKLARN